MSANVPPSGDSEIASAASAWLARRDRGFTAAEQDEFLQWLREDPRHGQALNHLQKAWGALDLLAEWRPAHSAQPNPDLLVGPQRIWRRRPIAALAAVTVALAAAAVVIIGLHQTPPPHSPTKRPESMSHENRTVRVIPAPERLLLEDGSTVEMNRDGRIEPAFTAAERRVRLAEGEAYFTVKANSVRPFVVEVDGMSVRAVGTAFNVRRVAGAVEVLVTEGKVEVAQSLPGSKKGPLHIAPTALAAGERVFVETGSNAPHPVVVAVSAPEIDRALSWRGVRLTFQETPLSEVVTEFNLRNRRQLRIADPAIAGLRVGGTFRADNVEAFARLLELSFGIAVENSPDGALVLRRAP